jgi:hypothetical protein
MQRRVILTCILLAFLTACRQAIAVPTLEPTGTQVPTISTQNTALPTETATLPPTPENSQTPENTPSIEKVTTSDPTLIPTPSLPPTPTATSLPLPAPDSGAIQFFNPGPLSKLVSPMVVSGYAIPGYNALGRLTLTGEDGRLLASKLMQLNTGLKWAFFYSTVSFEVAGAGELGRLTMATQDQYGRLTAVNSVHLILLPEGLSIINAPGNVKERCIIDLPAAGRRISGGSNRIAGELRPFNHLPVVIELIGRDNKVIASKAMNVQPAEDDRFVHFQVDLPYSISRGTWALLVVRQDDDRIGGVMYLFSREIFLNP